MPAKTNLLSKNQELKYIKSDPKTCPYSVEIIEIEIL